MEKQKRNSAIELLRIFAMLCIICSHYAYHGSVQYTDLPIGFNHLLLQLGILGNLGVDIFMLISGYFGVRGSFKPKKLIALLGEVFMYSAGIYLLLALLGKAELSFSNVLRAFLPTIYKQYWFFTVYIMIYLLSPFLNKMMQGLTKRQMQYFIGLLLVFWAIIPHVFLSSMYVNEFTQMLMVYCIGAYFSLFPEPILQKTKASAALALSGGVLMAGTVLLFTVLGKRSSFFAAHIMDAYMCNSVFVIAAALGLLLLFSKLRFSSRAVNTIAGCTFGVYLIHDNPFMRPVLWKTLFNNSAFAGTPKLILHMGLSVLLVFCACAVIEWIRKNTLERLLLKVLDKCKFLK